MLFGPAYKGIPLSVTTAIALSDEFDTDVRYCSNRKEVKDHGDVGILLGGPINRNAKTSYGYVALCLNDRHCLINGLTRCGYILDHHNTVAIVDRTAKQKLKKGLGDDMEQKLYKTVNSAGISSIVTGIIAVVAGLACVAGGILALIQGGRLLGARKNILF